MIFDRKLKKIELRNVSIRFELDIRETLEASIRYSIAKILNISKIIPGIRPGPLRSLRDVRSR